VATRCAVTPYRKPSHPVAVLRVQPRLHGNPLRATVTLPTRAFLHGAVVEPSVAVASVAAASDGGAVKYECPPPIADPLPLNAAVVPTGAHVNFAFVWPGVASWKTRVFVPLLAVIDVVPAGETV